MLRRSLALAFTLLAVAACGPKAEQAPPPAASPAQEAAVPAPPPPPPAVADEKKPCPPDMPCPDKEEPPGTVTITVDKWAGVDRTCVLVRKGQTDVDWVPGDGVDHFEIVFKPVPGGPPPDPETFPPGKKGRRLGKDKQKVSDKNGFPYKVVVYRSPNDTNPIECDPKLIVNP